MVYFVIGQKNFLDECARKVTRVRGFIIPPRASLSEHTSPRRFCCPMTNVTFYHTILRKSSFFERFEEFVQILRKRCFIEANYSAAAVDCWEDTLVAVCT